MGASGSASRKVVSDGVVVGSVLWGWLRSKAVVRPLPRLNTASTQPDFMVSLLMGNARVS